MLRYASEDFGALQTSNRIKTFRKCTEEVKRERHLPSLRNKISQWFLKRRKERRKTDDVWVCEEVVQEALDVLRRLWASQIEEEHAQLHLLLLNCFSWSHPTIVALKSTSAALKCRIESRRRRRTHLLPSGADDQTSWGRAESKHLCQQTETNAHHYEHRS